MHLPSLNCSTLCPFARFGRHVTGLHVFIASVRVHENEFRSRTSSIRSLHPSPRLHNCMHMPQPRTSLHPPPSHPHTHTCTCGWLRPVEKIADGSETNQLCCIFSAHSHSPCRPPGGDTEHSPTLFKYRSESQQEAGSSVQSLLTRSPRHNST